MDTATSDDELIRRFQQERDYAAFEEVFARHKDLLLRYLLRLVGDLAIAEDASQHTWLKVIEVARKNGYTSRTDATFRTWLFTLARNHVIDTHQRNRVVSRTVSLPNELIHEIVDESIDSASMDPEVKALEIELTQRVTAALDLLPFEQREVITLWTIGFDPHEIAGIIGAPRETIFSRKKYGIAKLRLALADLLPATRLT
jgi:RNA polymerase sigma factor (sigma-70 family)